jgi:hypothetical protein
MENLKHAIQKSCSSKSSFLPDQWSRDNPARGQCAVTALVVQDSFGGEIIRCDVVGDNDSHFYNKLPSGEIVDVTKSQFKIDVLFKNERVADRSNLLSHPETAERYELLKAAVNLQGTIPGRKSSGF